MENITHKNKVVGILVRKISAGSIPVTDGVEPLQVVTLKHPSGKYLVAHTHAPKKRTTNKLQECLLVKKGKVRLDLYGPDKKMFKKITIKEGDLFILQNGGFGIHLLDDSELVEVKNGPFIEDKVLL